jgi:hypothetical protein
MARGKVRKGRGGRVNMQRRDGSKGMGLTPLRQGKAIYCERCGLTGAHSSEHEVKQCFGRWVTLGVDYRWVRP